MNDIIRQKMDQLQFIAKSIDQLYNNMQAPRENILEDISHITARINDLKKIREQRL